jgi:hypothetical protein
MTDVEETTSCSAIRSNGRPLGKPEVKPGQRSARGDRD